MLLKILKSGALLSKIWPDIIMLNNVFKEGYIIKGLNFSKRVLPPIVALFIIWYFIYDTYFNISFKSYVFFAATFFIVIFLCTHIYALYVVGKFGLQKLAAAPKLLSWYSAICEELKMQAEADPSIMSLAKALRKSVQMDKNSEKKFKFWDML